MKCPADLSVCSPCSLLVHTSLRLVIKQPAATKRLFFLYLVHMCPLLHKQICLFCVQLLGRVTIFYLLTKVNMLIVMFQFNTIWILNRKRETTIHMTFGTVYLPAVSEYSNMSMNSKQTAADINCITHVQTWFNSENDTANPVRIKWM